MTGCLLWCKYELSNKYFENTKSRVQLSQGWIKMTYEINQNHGCTKIFEQVKASHQYLSKKWRGHKPTEAELTQTGDHKPDPMHCKNEKFSVTANFMAGKEECGTDSRQTQDVKKDKSSESDSKREAISQERTISATPSFRTPVMPTKSDIYSEQTNLWKVGLVGMAGGLKAATTFLSSHISDYVMKNILGVVVPGSKTGIHWKTSKRN